QNPERNSVPLRPASKSNAVMSNKHLWISQARSGTVENAVSVPLSHLEANCFPYKSTQSATQNLTAVHMMLLFVYDSAGNVIEAREHAGLFQRAVNALFA